MRIFKKALKHSETDVNKGTSLIFGKINFNSLIIIKMKKITLLAALFAGFAMNAQITIFEDDFDSEIIDATTYSKWTASDEDGDGENWEVFDATNTQYDSDGDDIPDTNYNWIMTGLGTDSDSWEGGAPLSPDNYLTTTDPIDLTFAVGSSLTYKVGTYQTNGQFINDQYSIYLTTSNDPADIEGETPVATKLVSDDVAADAVDGSTSAAEVTIDISAYDGQVVYLTFRHYNSVDVNSVLLDDIKIEAGSLGVTDQNFDGFKHFVANGQLNLSANTSMEKVALYNMLGQQVISQKLNSNNETVNISGLQSGVYIVTVSIEGASKTFRIVKN